MSSIPPELHFDILLRLHPKDLLRCMCVSKSWCSLIRDKRFIKAQLEASIEANCFRTVLVFGLYNSGYRDIYSLPFYHDDTFGTPKKTEKPLEVEGIYAGIVGCSNGVVCIYSWKGKLDYHMIAVWNPSIQKMKKLPSPTFDPPSSHRLKDRGPFFGFGYDSVNDDFKLVAIASFVNQGNLVDVSHVKTYSLKSNSWRRIQNLPCVDFEFANGMIVFCNGAMSMLMHNSHPLRHIVGSEFESRHIILTLDIATEEYHEFSIRFKYASSHRWVLGILGGCICTYVFDYNGDLCDVWIMKEYGVVESWTLLCSIDVQYIRPFYGYEYCCHQFPKDGAMLLFMGRMHSFSWYDLEKKSFKHVEVQGLPARQFDRMTICCASLYLLDGDDPVSGEVLSTSKKRKLSSNASGNVEATVDDQIREQK